MLLDLVYKTQDLVEERPGTIMVHCSAGVGRTGTFIGLYKLVDDYNNNEEDTLDVHGTVLDMRRCRRWMVQKKQQYHYIYKCLADYVAAQESEYHNL